MRFKFHGLSQADFEKWVQQAKANGTMLNRDAYLQLEKPSQHDPVKVFSGFDADLYDRIVNRCVAPGAACTTHMMAMDK
jgi:cytochrome o ubiquinol oxidase subunit 2